MTRHVVWVDNQFHLEIISYDSRLVNFLSVKCLPLAYFNAVRHRNPWIVGDAGPRGFAGAPEP